MLSQHRGLGHPGASSGLKKKKKEMLILKIFVKLIQFMYGNVAWINCTSVLQKLFLPPPVIIID